MAQQGGLGGQQQTGVCGNPIRQQKEQKDEYGLPIQRGGVTDQHGACTGVGGIGTDQHCAATGGGKATHGGGFGAGIPGVAAGGGGGLDRSGSSSSEDDELGGRRKKGLTEKIKEKLPGSGQSKQQYTPAMTGDTGAYGGGAQHPDQKKGMVEKIKEKLPGAGGKEKPSVQR